MSNDLRLIADFMENVFHKSFVRELRDLPREVFNKTSAKKMLKTVAQEECFREIHVLLKRNLTAAEKKFAAKWIDAFLKSHLKGRG